MDSSSDTVFVYGNCEFGRLIRLVAKYKGLSTADLDSAYVTPSVRHRNITMCGAWPIIDYLLDVVPYPDLMPETPAKRGVMRSLVNSLFNEQVGIPEFKELCVGNSVKACARRTTLLDLALLAKAERKDFIDNNWLFNLRSSLSITLELEAI